MRVLSIGSLNIDIVVQIEDFPELDSEVLIKDLYEMHGGSAANFAVALSKLGMNVSFFGAVGNDVYGDLLKKELDRNKVDTSYLKNVEGKSGLVVVLVDKTGENRMFAYRGANKNLNPDDLNKDFLSLFDWIHVASVERDIIMKVCKYCGKLSYSPGSIMVDFGLDYIEDIFNYCKYVFLNKGEALKLFGENLEEAKRYRSEFIITLGKQGSLLIGKETIRCKGYEVEVVDTTGAGDSFAAGFIYGILNYDVKKALKLANACAALKTTKIGARNSPTLSEVLSFLRERDEDCSDFLG
ncbi:MAG: carbohydrate kinase family protein [Candidatus Hydrothermarchaeota archaeon]